MLSDKKCFFFFYFSLNKINKFYFYIKKCVYYTELSLLNTVIIQMKVYKK